MIRPERVGLEPAGATGENRIPSMVERFVYTGPTLQVIVRLGPGVSLQVMVPNDGGATPYSQGAAVSAFLPPDALRVLPAGPEIPSGPEAEGLTGGEPAEAASGSA